MNKQKKLQRLANELRTNDQHEFSVEYRANEGWFAVPHECRWIGDDGEYIGRYYEQARYGLMAILG